MLSMLPVHYKSKDKNSTDVTVVSQNIFTSLNPAL
jgi:hypothetical protein